MSEIWLPVPGYEGLYIISNRGQVKSLDRPGHPGRVLRPQENSLGYGRVTLSRDNVKRRLFVHRLVAEVFLPRIPGCDVVNHLDFDKSNNAASNLEWTTQKGNVQWSLAAGRYRKGATA